jgi:hypothetical protein
LTKIEDEWQHKPYKFFKNGKEEVTTGIYKMGRFQPIAYDSRREAGESLVRSFNADRLLKRER